MSKFQKHEADFVLLLEAGFIAVHQMDERSALQLFETAHMLNDDNVMPKIGVGYLHLCKMELKKAASCFEEVLNKDPKNYMAKSFLGLAMALNPADMVKGEKMLTQAAIESSDPAVKKLANDAIVFVDSYLKKTPSTMMGDVSKKK